MNRNTSSAQPEYEVWYLKFNNPETAEAVWLRFTSQKSSSQERSADIWIIYFKKINNRTEKLALKTTSQECFQGTDIRLGENILGKDFTRGQVQSGEHKIRWNLQFLPRTDKAFNFVPGLLSRLKIVKNFAITECVDLMFSGEVDVDGRSSLFTRSPGMLGHLGGRRNGHSWAWSHCNSFVDESGTPVPFVCEAITARARLTQTLPTPRLSTFFFFYDNKGHTFNSPFSAFLHGSSYDLTGWNFQIGNSEISFNVNIKANVDEYVGVTYVDTDDTKLYCCNTKMADMKVEVVRPGRQKKVFLSSQYAAYEVTSRKQPSTVRFVL